MCGLVVMLGLAGRPADGAFLTRIAQSIAHRGPDHSGLYFHRHGYTAPVSYPEGMGLTEACLREARILDVDRPMPGSAPASS